MCVCVWGGSFEHRMLAYSQLQGVAYSHHVSFLHPVLLISKRVELVAHNAKVEAPKPEKVTLYKL